MELNMTKRYATANLVSKIDEDVQRLLWSLLDAFLSETAEPDYLQIYKLKVAIHKGELMQEVRHSQEVPPMGCEKGCFQVGRPYEGVIWIYLDEDKQTMLIPEDC